MHLQTNTGNDVKGDYIKKQEKKKRSPSIHYEELVSLLRGRAMSATESE